MLPLPYSRIAQWINRTILMRGINRWMRAVGVTRPVVWTFLPTPLARDLIAAIDPALTIYYCIDDLASSSHEARKIATSEQALFKEADLVFVTSERLRQRAAAVQRPRPPVSVRRQPRRVREVARVARDAGRRIWRR